MSSNSSFGGKLRKVLASMCSLFVGASGVSRAKKPDTNIPTELKLGEDAYLFGFGDFGWKLASGDANKENSWLVLDHGNRYQRFGKVYEINFDVGFACSDLLCSFCIWADNDSVVEFSIPKGILFDVMRHFEREYFPDGDPRDKGTQLSCSKVELGGAVANEVFLRFILWAFCGSKNAIKPGRKASVEELKEGIFECVVNANNPANAGDKFDIKGEGENRFAVLKSGYFLENFNKRVREVYKDLGYDMTDVDGMGKLIIQLNKEKKDLKNQKHTGKYLLCTLIIGLVGGGALVEGAHRFLGAKRSENSEVNKGKPSSNKKGGQKAKKELKKRRG